MSGLTVTLWSRIWEMIQNGTKRSFANRVSQIREITETNHWRHISGRQNFADVLSQGCIADSIPEILYHGPVFLRVYKWNWPENRDELHVWVCDLKVRNSDLECTCDVVAAVDNTPVHPMAALITHCLSCYLLQKALSFKECWNIWEPNRQSLAQYHALKCRMLKFAFCVMCNLRVLVRSPRP